MNMNSFTDISPKEEPKAQETTKKDQKKNKIASASNKRTRTLGLPASVDGVGLPNVSQLAYQEAKDNFLGSTTYTGKCSKYVYDVYKNIGFPLGKFNTAARTGNYPTLEPTTDPVPGDIVQYLKSDGANFDHVAIYAGDNSMFSSSSLRGMIIPQTLLQFNRTVTPQYFHYVGQN